MNGIGPQRWFFDAWARVYDVPIVQRRTYRPLHDEVIDALENAAPRRILDLGCGTGQLARRLSTSFRRARVIGCDFSAGMLHQAADRCPTAALVQGDAGDLPFADQSFDAIVCTEAFHWFPDQRGALAECFRVLRPGGRLLIAMINTPAVSLSELFHIGSSLVGEPFYWPSREQTREWIAAAGFRIAAQRTVMRFGTEVLAPIFTDARRPRQRSIGARRPHRSVGERRADGRSFRSNVRTRAARSASNELKRQGKQAHANAHR